ncbi:MAG: energy-coupling factor ABC transporter permease [Thiohalocapsa sp.]|uniref:energy-coupling factor ABC transporter permease n=1 Tax=Thiohalocapsa sp. TaxID=2497641 RepID=UPI0025CFD6DF|nr:energy-coupling factor ABC transporter permease [Thiohalocapsa sp.]MCG6940459.1 energy-coupling factor ABC transporter permease [Thiohalocapsa sp.]
MSLDPALFSSTATSAAVVLYLLCLALALWLAPWRKLLAARLTHVFFGACVLLMFLWHMETQVQPGLSYHLLGLTAVTLIFGWSLAVIAAAVALLGVYLNTGMPWDGFALNALVGGVLPITLTQVALVLIRHYLPKQFFVYVMVNGFLTAGLVGVVMGYSAAWLLVGSGAYTFAELSQTVLPLFPLMFLPEAMLNGWIMVILVAFRPQWVYSFSDEQYLKGK